MLVLAVSSQRCHERQLRLVVRVEDLLENVHVSVLKLNVPVESSLLTCVRPHLVPRLARQ